MEIGLPGACELARHGLNNVVSICKSQIPEALEMTSMLLRARGDAVIVGLAPSTLPRPDDPTLAQVPAPALPPKEPHFTYRPIDASRPAYQGFVQG
jgi:hypothetical protein